VTIGFATLAAFQSAKLGEVAVFSSGGRIEGPPA